jgi:hypothetical protein
VPRNYCSLFFFVTKLDGPFLTSCARNHPFLVFLSINSNNLHYYSRQRVLRNRDGSSIPEFL